MSRDGIGANVNPFSVIEDEDICDGSLVRVAPKFFIKDGDTLTTLAPVMVRSPARSQKSAEALVCKLQRSDPNRSFAVKEEFFHIIPLDLRDEIRVTKSSESTCHSRECYFLGEMRP